jgi:hypothetical protein
LCIKLVLSGFFLGVLSGLELLVALTSPLQRFRSILKVEPTSPTQVPVQLGYNQISG